MVPMTPWLLLKGASIGMAAAVVTATGGPLGGFAAAGLAGVFRLASW
jgi:hypothetical protein